MPKPSLQKCAGAGIAFAAVAFLFVAALEDHSAALSNPLGGGKNIKMVATTKTKRVPAQGTNCSVTFVNTGGEVLCTGFGTAIQDGGIMADGGMDCTTSLDVCGSSTAGCLNNWLTRDAVPDALWFRMKTAADGGVGIRIEMGAGCQTP